MAFWIFLGPEQYSRNFYTTFANDFLYIYNIKIPLQCGNHLGDIGGTKQLLRNCDISTANELTDG